MEDKYFDIVMISAYIILASVFVFYILLHLYIIYLKRKLRKEQKFH